VDEPTASGPRARLLAAVIDHLLADGLRDPTLRELARGVGTSHRMLIYHFGSREGLLAAVVEEIERRQLAALAQLRDTGDPEATMRAMHARLADPELAPVERLFFQVYARALSGSPDAARLLPGAVDSWLDALEPAYEAFGFSRAHARAEATLALATARGLLLDLLATGDRARIDAAAGAYVDGVMRRLPAGHRR
jgi:AcrR family transcriptional regulator